MFDPPPRSPMDLWAYNGFSAVAGEGEDRPAPASPDALPPLHRPPRRASGAAWRVLLGGAGLSLAVAAAALLALPGEDVQRIVHVAWPAMTPAAAPRALTPVQQQHHLADSVVKARADGDLSAREQLAELAAAAERASAAEEAAPSALPPLAPPPAGGAAAVAHNPPPAAPVRTARTVRTAASRGAGACALHATAIERLMCRYPNFTELDFNLHQAYEAAIRSGAPSGLLAEQQESWVARRDEAAESSPEAVLDLYRERIAQLNDLKRAPQAVDQP